MLDPRTLSAGYLEHQAMFLLLVALTQIAAHVISLNFKLVNF